jgi:hypothetical protein
MAVKSENLYRAAFASNRQSPSAPPAQACLANLGGHRRIGPDSVGIPIDDFIVDVVQGSEGGCSRASRHGVEVSF